MHKSHGIIMWTSIGVLALVGIAGCASTPGSGAGNGFPDPAKARFAGGSYPNVDNVLMLSTEMNKDHLYQLVGPPHFNEGVFGVREWDYLFNFRSHEGRVVTCQLKVSFDSRGQAEAFRWLPGECAPDAGLRKTLYGSITTSGHDVVTERVAILTADATFAFGSDAITPLGRRALDEAMGRLGGVDGLERVDIVGHADRIGSAAANDVLAQARAQAVRNYLLTKGMPADVITAQGRGSREPIVDCAGVAGADLVACLAPNRRVELFSKRSGETLVSQP